MRAPLNPCGWLVARSIITVANLLVHRWLVHSGTLDDVSRNVDSHMTQLLRSHRKLTGSAAANCVEIKVNLMSRMSILGQDAACLLSHRQRSTIIANIVHTCAWVKNTHKLRFQSLLGGRLLVRALWNSLRLQVLPDEKRPVAVNAPEAKHTLVTYDILHDRSARGEHGRLVGAIRFSSMAPPVLNR
jgi:hypothetical protein